MAQDEMKDATPEERRILKAIEEGDLDCVAHVSVWDSLEDKGLISKSPFAVTALGRAALLKAQGN